MKLFGHIRNGVTVYQLLLAPLSGSEKVPTTGFSSWFSFAILSFVETFLGFHRSSAWDLTSSRRSWWGRLNPFQFFSLFFNLAVARWWCNLSSTGIVLPFTLTWHRCRSDSWWASHQKKGCFHKWEKLLNYLWALAVLKKRLLRSRLHSIEKELRYNKWNYRGWLA